MGVGGEGVCVGVGGRGGGGGCPAGGLRKRELDWHISGILSLPPGERPREDEARPGGQWLIDQPAGR